MHLGVALLAPDMLRAAIAQRNEQSCIQSESFTSRSQLSEPAAMGLLFVEAVLVFGHSLYRSCKSA